jgi:hypothetical protein
VEDFVEEEVVAMDEDDAAVHVPRKKGRTKMGRIITTEAIFSEQRTSVLGKQL